MPSLCTGVNKSRCGVLIHCLKVSLKEWPRAHSSRRFFIILSLTGYVLEKYVVKMCCNVVIDNLSHRVYICTVYYVMYPIVPTTALKQKQKRIACLPVICGFTQGSGTNVSCAVLAHTLCLYCLPIFSSCTFIAVSLSLVCFSSLLRVCSVFHFSSSLSFLFTLSFVCFLFGFR